MQVKDKLDGIDHYGVMLFVHDVDLDAGEIMVSTHKQNSSRHDDKVRLYRENGEWGCSMWDNYAVIDKALSILND